MGILDSIVDAVTGLWKKVVTTDQIASGEATCRVVRRVGLPNVCRGSCPAGERCIVTETERYLVFFRQAKSCRCAIQL
jgi:hypothetical protein